MFSGIFLSMSKFLNTYAIPLKKLEGLRFWLYLISYIVEIKISLSTLRAQLKWLTVGDQVETASHGLRRSRLETDTTYQWSLFLDALLWYILTDMIDWSVTFDFKTCVRWTTVFEIRPSDNDWPKLHWSDRFQNLSNCPAHNLCCLFVFNYS